jgi:short-subunit dehydrogenase involved in D-alanine esterification of teichoic acids
LAFVPLPISPVYCATKAGLHSFTESLRAQLKNTKVKVFDLEHLPVDLNRKDSQSVMDERVYRH